MNNQILDEFTTDVERIRLPKAVVIEVILFVFNGLFLVVGIGLSWRAAFNNGIWLLLINPPVFIVLFGLLPILFIRKWRRLSMAYEAGESVSWSDLDGVFLDFTYKIGGAIWTGISVLGIFFGWYTTIYALFLLLFPALVLGPLQFWYIRRCIGIKQKMLDKSDENS